jgi:hypothetical protein
VYCIENRFWSGGEALIGSKEDFNIIRSIEQYFNHRIDEITIENINELEQVE